MFFIVPIKEKNEGVEYCMTDILYHYCSIETLELILKNKTFRFSSLGIVDDMEEVLTSDFDDIGRICFVSCWTDLKQESVEMWRTYTGGNNGIRIGIPTNLFNLNKDEESVPLLVRELMEVNDVFISPPYTPELIPVTYTKDDYLINLPVGTESNDSCKNCESQISILEIQTGYLGRFKRDYWSGQSEWRYRLIAIPKEYYRNNEQGKYLNGDPKKMMNLMKLDLIHMAFNNDYIDFPFNESVLDQMDIVLSPLNSGYDNEKATKLIQNYTTHATIKLSALKMRK